MRKSAPTPTESKSPTGIGQQVQRLAADAGCSVERMKRSVEVLAATLAKRMSEIHGLKYRVQIDHSAGIEFVLVVPCFGRNDPIAPKQGESA